MFRSAQWRLIAKTIPIMIVIVLTKLVVNAVHADVLTLSPLFSGIVAANFFLLGFLLAGTLTDFKESERLIVELASSLESIADECSLLHRTETAREMRACLESTLTLAHQIRRWFTRHPDIR